MADDPLNVLLLSGRFELRGSTAYSMRLARNLAGHGVCPRVFSGDARQLDPATRAELPLVEFPYLLMPVFGRVVLEGMARELKAAPPDLIHIQSRSVLGHGIRLAQRLQVPYVATVHDFLPPREKLQVDLARCRRIIAVSKAVQSDLLSRGNLPDELVTMIHTGVDIFEGPSVPVLDPGHVPVIGTAGPLEAVKGLTFFLGAAQRVLSQRHHVEFLIAGAGPEEENLRRLARELRVAEHVTFVSNMHNFSQALQAMDVFCLPSLRQGLGSIMLEAMALGKPVIATGVGGVYSVVRNNETGFVVAAADSEQLAQRMVQLLEDPVLARAIGEAGRASVAQEFGVERMVAQTVEVYRAALQPAAAATAAG